MGYTKKEKQRIMKLTGWSEKEFETATTMVFMDRKIPSKHSNTTKRPYLKKGKDGKYRRVSS